MQVVNYTHARNNLKSIIDTVCDDNEEVIITTKNNKSVIVISLDKHNKALSKIKKSVQKSIKEIELEQFMSADEAFDIAMRSYRD